MGYCCSVALGQQQPKITNIFVLSSPLKRQANDLISWAIHEPDTCYPWHRAASKSQVKITMTGRRKGVEVRKRSPNFISNVIFKTNSQQKDVFPFVSDNFFKYEYIWVRKILWYWLTGIYNITYNKTAFVLFLPNTNSWLIYCV